MIAVLAVTSSSIVCLFGEIHSEGSYSILFQSEAAFPGLRRGRPVSSFGLQKSAMEAVQIAQKNVKGKPSEFYVGVPGAFCTVTLNNPLAKNANEAGEIEPPAEHEYMDDKNELIHRYPASLPGAGAQMGRGMVGTITADREYVAEMTEALKSIGHRPASILCQNYAEGLFIVPRTERDNVAILINVGYYNTDICIFSADAQLYLATLYVGGAHVVSDLSQVLEIDRNYAEQLLKQFVFGIEYEPGAKDYIRLDDGRLTSFEHSIVDQVIQARMDETCRLISSAIDESGIELSEKSKVYLIGESLAGMRGVREFLGAHIGRRVENLPLDMSDGATRYNTSALSMFDYVTARLNAKRARGPIFKFRRK